MPGPHWIRAEPRRLPSDPMGIVCLNWLRVKSAGRAFPGVTIGEVQWYDRVVIITGIVTMATQTHNREWRRREWLSLPLPKQ